MSIIIVHEFGHLLMAKYYKWKVDKIYIYPLGGITKFNDCINRPIKEELMIVLMGPIFQIIYYYILILLGINDVFLFNLVLLSFNMLPIYPLDGGKILSLFLSYFFPYKKVMHTTIVLSFISYVLALFFLIISTNSLFFILVFIFLILKIIEECSKTNFYFNKFLLERYLNTYQFKKIKCIDAVEKMQRDKKHLFKKNNVITTEKEELRRYFCQ